jgi:hypothetical protein
MAQRHISLSATPKADKIGEPRAEGTKTSEILRKRMVNVLDVLETIKSSSTTPKKITEVPRAQIETTTSDAEATKHQAETEAGLQSPPR